MMDFNEYLKQTLENDSELKKEYDALQPEYEIIDKLIRVRCQQNLTQKQLAEKCGIKQSNISRLERGKANPTIKFLQKIADALDYDLVIEFRKRVPATESCIVSDTSVGVPIEIKNPFDAFKKIGSTQNTGSFMGGQRTRVCSIG